MPASTSPPPSTTSTAGRISGTAYEKIAADVIARYKRLAGFDDAFRDGQRRALAERVPQGARARRWIRWRTATGWSRSSATSGERLDISFDDFIRTTEPRHRAGVQELVAAHRRRRRHLRRRTTRAGTASSCEAFKQEKDLVDGLCPIHRTQAGLDPREELLLPAVEVQRAAARALRRRIPEFLEPDVRRNEILRLLEGGLEDISVSRAGQAWGIPLPFDPSSVVYVWFDALINYVAAVGFGTDDGAVREVVAGRSARHRQGHHAVPRRDLAGDADERRAAAAAAGLRPRLGASQGREDEQVARHDRRSARGGRAVRARSAAAVPRRRRSRSAATATSRGSGSRSATTSIWRTTSATWSAASRRWPRSIAAARLAPRRAARAARRRSRAQARRRLPRRRWTRSRSSAARRRRSASSTRPTSSSPRPSRGRSRATPARADELSQVLFDVAEAVRVAGGAAAAGHAAVGRRDPAPRRRDAGRPAISGSPTPRGSNDGDAPDTQGRCPVAARGIRGAEGREDREDRDDAKPSPSTGAP